MAPNPWVFRALEVVEWHHGPCEVKITLRKRDVRGGFDLGGMKERSFVVIKHINLSSKDKLYWKEIFKSVINAGNEWGITVPYHRAKEVIQNIRTRRYHRKRPRFKTWADRYGKRVADWATNIIESELEDSCKDNYRLARVGDKKAVRYYEMRQDSGCCGRFDITRRCPYDWFRQYLIGCNYGH